jgi:hypothetical protein
MYMWMDGWMDGWMDRWIDGWVSLRLDSACIVGRFGI